MENTVIKHFLHLFLLGLQFQVSYPPTLDRSIDVQLSSLYVAISPSYKSLVKWTRSDRKVSPPQRPRHFPLKPLLLSSNRLWAQERSSKVVRWQPP